LSEIVFNLHGQNAFFHAVSLRVFLRVVLLARYRVVYERVGCIGAAVCVAVYPKRLELDADGKANLLGSVKNGDVFELELNDGELSEMKQAAEGCPVNVIHIINLETGEKII